jgi:hypothetical protein
MPELYVDRTPNTRFYAVFCRPASDDPAGPVVVATDTRARAYQVRRQLVAEARRCDACGTPLSAHTKGKPPADRSDRFVWEEGDLTITGPDGEPLADEEDA